MNTDLHIRMTGPYPSQSKRGRKEYPSWQVALVNRGNEPQGPIYQCLNYRRAVALSCNMARDRRLCPARRRWC